jgi:hypothetical protein
MKRPLGVEFEAASGARRLYRLNPREAYVLHAAPIRGIGRAGRTIWFVGDENLTHVVEGLLKRGFLGRRHGAGPAYADLTTEGREALAAGQAR